MSSSPGRTIGIVVGAVAILGVGVYAPAMLLGPLPEVQVVAAAPPAAPPPSPLALPGDGASAVARVAEEPVVLATAGDATALPIGAAAKLVTALVTSEALPFPTDGAGAELTIGPQDYTEYLQAEKEGTRALPVSPGDRWSQRDVTRAMLLASSNNHADTLARWAFGSVDAYVERANGWLESHGFETLRVADATGLSGDSVGTAEEVARLAAMALAQPTIASIVDGEKAAGARDVPLTVDHAGEDGVEAIVRGYTDQAGLVFVGRAPIGTAEDAEEAVVAFVRMPDYETLDPAIAAFVQSVPAASAAVPVITEGTRYGEVRALWGERSALVAAGSREAGAWGAAPGEPELVVEPFATAAADRIVGEVRVPVAGETLTTGVRLESAIDDPGPIWRLTNPGAIIGAFVDAQQAR
jgi:D-alanyl-D-alanine carboxypeptidase (penicillin-binding protein 5/6)